MFVLHYFSRPTSTKQRSPCPLDEEHARALEEQWIDSIDNAGTASLSQSSPSNSTVLQGILLGFFFPLLPFFFMRNAKPPVFWADGSDYEPPANVIFSLVFLIHLSLYCTENHGRTGNACKWDLLWGSLSMYFLECGDSF